MKIVSVFNNKGGVGKTTLTYHLAHALAEMGRRVLVIDIDPQCNLTIYSMTMEAIHSLWKEEDAFIDDFARARTELSPSKLSQLLGRTRTIHFLLKPTEDGTADMEQVPPPIQVKPTLFLIPGRLTMHMYEAKIAERWSGVYQGEPLAIRTATRIRNIAKQYAQLYNIDYTIVDTSPSLGALNRLILITADGFVIPCMPDLFSLYGIRNIGSALKGWKQQFDTIFQLLSDTKRSDFPAEFIQFLGFTIYNAKRYSGQSNRYQLAQAHYNYAEQIPPTIRKYIIQPIRSKLSDQLLKEPIGGLAVMHTHNTLPSMAQKYQCPIWEVPGRDDLDQEDKSTIRGNRQVYEATREAYLKFAEDFETRIQLLDVM